MEQNKKHVSNIIIMVQSRSKQEWKARITSK